MHFNNLNKIPPLPFMHPLENNNSIIFGDFIKIKHKTDSARKEFIIDLVYIAIAKALFEVSLNGSFIKDEDIISIHRNKHRKQFKKIKVYYDEFLNLINQTYNRLDKKDIGAIEKKTKVFAIPFIRTMVEYKGISLEKLAINILDVCLSRDRKNSLYEELKPFVNYNLLYEKFAKQIEIVGVEDSSTEFDIAKKLAKKIKY